MSWPHQSLFLMSFSSFLILLCSEAPPWTGEPGCSPPPNPSPLSWGEGSVQYS